MKKSGLGRGLDALLPDIGTQQPESEIQTIKTSLIDRNTAQPRQNFDPASLQELADSIREVGVLQPILVTPRKDRYTIVAGERRFRACMLAGLDSIPCIVRSLNNEEMAEIALIENLQREDLNPMEESAAIAQLIRQFDYTQETAARRLGRSRPAIANALRLLSLEKSVQDDIAKGLISAGHGKMLAGIQDEQLQRDMADRIIQNGLSVRELEQLIEQKKTSKRKPSRRGRQKLTPTLKDMEDRFRESVGVKVNISGTEKQGKVTLQYFSPTELDSIYQALEALESNRR